MNPAQPKDVSDAVEHGPPVAGNVMTSGGVGAWWYDGSSSSVLLKNDFSGAEHRGLAYTGTNGVGRQFLVLRNTLGQGRQFHLKQPGEDHGVFFFGENTFLSGTNVVSPFISPASAPAHFR